MSESVEKPDRRSFLKRSALIAGGAAAVGTGGYWIGTRGRVSRSMGKKVIIIGIDGMDPVLCESMMKDDKLPNLSKLRAQGGFSPLGTSCPPQSPVAWANFINGAGPGSHGIFDFIHRHPEDQCRPFYSAAETIPPEGGWKLGKYRLQVTYPPINHKEGATVLKRQGAPFWDHLDAHGVPTTFYDLPSNYPASPSTHGHHRCLCGMGTPDLLGTPGTYQYFAQNVPEGGKEVEGGRHSRLVFDGETATATILGPENSLLMQPQKTEATFQIHRDRDARAAVIELQGKRAVLAETQWSRWMKIDFPLTDFWSVVDKKAAGIVRFYLQEVSPNFRLYMTPINIDPRSAAVPISEPTSFVSDIAARRREPFYTTGFQEDFKARTNDVFDDGEYLRQATEVLNERLALYEQAVNDYDDGLLFFYFSSSDLQSHMFWWDSDEKHPTRSESEAKKYFGHIHRLYERLDRVVGDLMDRYGSLTTIIVMSDHGFANWGRQFNLNTWLRDNGYIQPGNCTSLMEDVDWSSTTAYGLGINGLYLNKKGRERDGFVEPDQVEEKLEELKERLLDVKDVNGEQVIRGVYRSDQIYSGNATALAPDLIIGYRRGYRASWETCLGTMTDQDLLDNDRAWSADHCADALEVPGVLFCNRPIRGKDPSLVDLAPSILAEFGLPAPAAMSGKVVF